MPIAHGDGARLVEQDGIDVAGHFDGLTAFGNDVGPQARSMPAMPIAASRAPIVVGIKQTSSATKRRHIGTQALYRLGGSEIGLHVLLGIQGHRPERRRHDQEDQA